MKISVVEPGSRFRVDTDSGAIFLIRYVGSADADPKLVGLWECECRACTYGRKCEHLRAFLASSLPDYNPYDNTSGPASITV